MGRRHIVRIVDHHHIVPDGGAHERKDPGMPQQPQQHVVVLDRRDHFLQRIGANPSPFRIGPPGLFGMVGRRAHLAQFAGGQRVRDHQETVRLKGDPLCIRHHVPAHSDLPSSNLHSPIRTHIPTHSSCPLFVRTRFGCLPARFQAFEDLATHRVRAGAGCRVTGIHRRRCRGGGGIRPRRWCDGRAATTSQDKAGQRHAQA